MNKIAKRCYEKKFSTQKYKDSVLYGTFDDVMDNIVRESMKKVFEILEKNKLIDMGSTTVKNVENRFDKYNKIKRYCFLHFAKR